MNYTKNPLEQIMKQVPKGHPSNNYIPPRNKECLYCSYFSGSPCFYCIKELRDDSKKQMKSENI